MKIRTAVLLPDIHYPEHSVVSMNLVKKLIKDIKPDEIIYQGDNLDMGVISHWNLDKKRKVELKRLKQDYSGFEKEILDPIEALAGKKTKFVWLNGNHEDWANQYLDKNPELEGIIEPEICLNLKERGYEIVPYNNIYKLGKLNIIHGYYHNKYHADKTLGVFEESICYGHMHSPQMQSKTKPMDSSDFHAAYGLPCLCDLSPDYMKNRPNAWVHGFGVVYIMPDGSFNLYPIIIINNKFIFQGKLYESKKKTTV
jgi:predicted phosphodiesterase